MKLVWTATAARDLREVRRTIAEHDPAAARRVVAALRQVSERLLVFPHSGRPGRVPGTRELVIPGLPFILPYTVRGDRVVILAVIHATRSWPESF